MCIQQFCFCFVCGAEMKLSIKSCCRSCGVAAEVERFHGIQHTHPPTTHTTHIAHTQKLSSSQVIFLESIDILKWVGKKGRAHPIDII
jgi:hypothetical protein